ncbi:MAG: nitroreductase family protein [Deltaproteobacteria bacterium]|jgi:nitroreductase|nr:nitroreductase family protein [Deltaproteobacteria bacterium]
MSDFQQLVLKRQSCRDYDADKPIEHDKLVRCLDAARQTPSACNSQPWSVVVVEDPAKLAEVAKATHQLGLNEYDVKARAFFVVLEEYAQLMPKIACLADSQVFAKGDLGAFTYALTLAAEAEGLGTCILGLFDRPKLRELLDIPKSQPIFMVVAVGYPAKDTVRSKVRKPIDAISRFV